MPKWAVAGAILTALLPARGRGAQEPEEPPACQRVLAEAQSRASLLFAPRLSAQMLRLPNGGDIDGTNIFRQRGFQVRAALSFSPLDVYRGTTLISAAHTACQQLLAAQRVEDTLRQGSMYGQSEALRAQLKYLHGQISRVTHIVGEAEQRLHKQISTRFEVDQLRLKQLRIEQEMMQIAAELEQLESRGFVSSDGAQLSADLSHYELNAVETEEKKSQLRRLKRWNVDMRAGAIPDEQMDWFGMFQLSYNLGGIWQSSAEDRYLESRSEQLHTSRSELRQRLMRFREEMRLSADRTRSEIDLIEKQEEVLRRQRAGLAGRSTRASQHALATNELDLIRIKARRVYLQQLLEQRMSIGE